jgi:hypothetical protein
LAPCSKHVGVPTHPNPGKLRKLKKALKRGAALL